jgi:general secretion pathway protein N
MRTRLSPYLVSKSRTGLSGWRWAAGGGVLGTLLAVVLFAPAQWLAWGVASLSGQRVLLQDVRGTLWQGSARVTLSGGPGTRVSTSLPGRLNWQTEPNSQGLQLQLLASCCMAKVWTGQFSPRLDALQLQLAALESQWPADLLSGLGTPWNTLQPQGQLRLSSPGLDFDWRAGRSQFKGRVQLDAVDVSSRLSTLQPMGSYRIELQGGASPSLSLSTLRGALQLSGRGQLVGDQLRFKGEASAAAGFEGVLSNLLNIIGRRQGARSIIQVG